MKTVLQTVLISLIVFLICFSVGKSLLKEDSNEIIQHTETLGSADLIPNVVEKVVPSVVSIVISANVPVIERYYENLEGPFGGLGIRIPAQRQVGTKLEEIGGGTGFFVSKDGYLVTNKHVVSDPTAKYSVVTNDGESYDVNIIAQDPTLDVAILKVEAAREFPFLSFADSNTVRLGQSVIAIGNVLAEFPNSVSVGVVSGLSRNIVAGDESFAESLEGVIQTDAAINRGNSGGPLLDLRGNVIGVNVAVAGYGENIGFALPGSVVESVVKSVQKNGTIVRPYLGIRYVPITKSLMEEEKLTTSVGALITSQDEKKEPAIIPGSPAEKAGLKRNDIITEVDGEKISASTSLSLLLRKYAVGDTVTLTVLRGERVNNVSVTLEAFDQE